MHQPHWQTLPNGFRILTLEMPWLNSLRFDLYLRGGSRWENPELAGTAHFVEHMLFNGTRSFPSTIEHCLAAAEIGGAMNGEVDQEMSSYSFWTRPQHLERGLGTFSSMFTEPLFDPGEMELEKKIVMAEIAEQPKAKGLDELLWPNHPLSNPVPGTRARIRALTREQVVDYYQRFYVPDNMVLVVTGPVGHAEVERLAARYFGRLEGGFAEAFQLAPPPSGAPRIRFNVLHDSPAYQVSIAFPFGLPDPRSRAGIWLLNTLLGTSDTSRLFLKVREEMGLVYSIDSQVAMWSDTGLVEIEFKASRQKLRAAFRSVLAEIERLMVEPVSSGELTRAKEWRIASLESLFDDPENLGRRYASAALFGDELPLKELIDLSERTAPGELTAMARAIFSATGPCLLVQGPELPAKVKLEFRASMKRLVLPSGLWVREEAGRGGSQPRNPEDIQRNRG